MAKQVQFFFGGGDLKLKLILVNIFVWVTKNPGENIFQCGEIIMVKKLFGPKKHSSKKNFRLKKISGVGNF